MTSRSSTTFFRANMYLISGGATATSSSIPAWGLARLSEAIAAEPGKPLLALATHIHVDHVGSLNEFAERAGPASSAAAFATMDDALTYADMYSGAGGAGVATAGAGLESR